MIVLYRLSFLLFLLHISLHSVLEVSTVWGKEIITDPCAIELMQSSLMKRIEEIDQSGPSVYVSTLPYFSRFDHCVGVYLLLRKAGVAAQEQIAGLLHDASHTVFSHLGDYLFGAGDGTKSYQDGIHLEYLKTYKDVVEILDRYGYSMEDMDPDKEEYTALENQLPDICADRIQYIVHTGVMLNYITTFQAAAIINAIKFENGQWFFTDPYTAYTFSHISVVCTQTLWGHPHNAFYYTVFKYILIHALQQQLISYHDMHYKTDQEIITVLQASSDQYIQRLLSYTHNPFMWYSIVGQKDSTYNWNVKCRAVNPLVKTFNGFRRLTAIDASYAKEYEEVQEWCKKGYGIKFFFKL